MNGFAKAHHVDKVVQNLEHIFVNSSIVNENSKTSKKILKTHNVN